MPLYVVATPIGNQQDLSPRALETLKSAELIIGEEAKVTRRLLKSLGLSPRIPIEILNEHSDQKSKHNLAELCQNQKVALVSDCGTPGFCDPGADLVRCCRQLKIPIHSLPGPSSLMCFLSLVGHRLDRFHFEGFLPANTEKRKERLMQLERVPDPMIFMDTPYRLEKTLQNCADHFSNRKIVLGTALSTPDEQVLEGSAKSILGKFKNKKVEFVLAVLAE